MALIQCTECGNSISDRAPACPQCGAPAKHPWAATSDASSSGPCSRGIYIIIGLLLGGIGAHNFYAGHHSVGALQLGMGVFTWVLFAAESEMGFLAAILLAIWIISDLLRVDEDGQGRMMT